MIESLYKVKVEIPRDIYEDIVSVDFYNEWTTLTVNAVLTDTAHNVKSTTEIAIFNNLDEAYEFQCFLNKFFNLEVKHV